MQNGDKMNNDLEKRVRKFYKRYNGVLPSNRKERFPLESKAEFKVLVLAFQGLSNKQIGKRLFIAEKTVKFHLTNIYKRTRVKSRHQLAWIFWNELFHDVFSSTEEKEKVIKKIREPEKKPLPPPMYPSVLPRGSA